MVATYFIPKRWTFARYYMVDNRNEIFLAPIMILVVLDGGPHLTFFTGPPRDLRKPTSSFLMRYTI